MAPAGPRMAAADGGYQALLVDRIVVQIRMIGLGSKSDIAFFLEKKVDSVKGVMFGKGEMDRPVDRI